MRKLLISSSILATSLIGADLWESSWNRGESSYVLSNKANQTLSFDCSMEYAHLSVQDSNGNFVGSEEDIIKIILNDDTQITIPAKIEAGFFKTQHDSWFDLVYDIPNSKKIKVVIDNKEFVFNPKNGNKISDISTSCREYFEQ
jgi:hypothetical protein